jgi:hypothetical protein
LKDVRNELNDYSGNENILEEGLKATTLDMFLLAIMFLLAMIANFLFDDIIQIIYFIIIEVAIIIVVYFVISSGTKNKRK